MEFPHLSSETLSKVPGGNPGITERTPGPCFTLGSEGIAPEAEAAPSFTGAGPQPCPVSLPEDRPSKVKGHLHPLWSGVHMVVSGPGARVVGLPCHHAGSQLRRAELWRAGSTWGPALTLGAGNGLKGRKGAKVHPK